jgi:glycosyltransferase involved in cell wall biosynthesis
LIEKYDIQIVYSNTIACLEGALAAHVTRRPHLWHLREQIDGNQDLRSILPSALVNRLVARFSDRVIVNSQALGRAFGERRRRAVVVYNGFDLEKVESTGALRSQLIESEQLPEDAVLVAIVGSITPRKGHLVLARAASRVVRSCTKTYFIVVGRGADDYVARVKREIAALELTSRFRFLGWRSDIEALMGAFDLLVVASEQEAFGRTIVEAMGAEVPVVATRSGGPEEIVANQETGLLVPINDVNAMADAICELASDEQLREAFGRAGRARAESLFGIGPYVARLQSVIVESATGFWQARKGARGS